MSDSLNRQENGMTINVRGWARAAKVAADRQAELPGVDRRRRKRPNHALNERAAAAMLLLLAGEIDREEFARRLVTR